MQISRRAALGAIAASLLGACAAPTTAAAARPQLVVLLVVDGLPQWQVTRWREQLAPDGFRRFLDRGAWHAHAYHRHSFTVTAAGHATLATGAYPHRSGIVGNEWLDPGSGQEVYNTMDRRWQYIGHPTNPLDGTSPANLLVETFGDVLRRVHPGSKVIGISGKDRGAILPAGHAGTAYMYMDETGRFASSTYYMASHPAWVDRFHADAPANRYFHARWEPLLPADAYAGDVPDAQPWFRDPGARLPMVMGEDRRVPDRTFYTSLRVSPFIDALSLDFALAAVEGERLGMRGETDVLAVSLSGHDYVNHADSAESRLSHDHLLQLDRLLQSFFAGLDARVGAGNYVAVLSADHGFMPVPEVASTRGERGGRISGAQLVKDVDRALAARFGAGHWVHGFSAGGLLLDHATIEREGLRLEEVAQAARDAVLRNPATLAAYTRGEIESRSAARAPFFEAVLRSWHAGRSGDVQMVPRPFWMAGARGATHGSPHEYDAHVPLMWWGPGRFRTGRIDDSVETVDLAPTLATLLGIAAPRASEGRILDVLVTRP